MSVALTGEKVLEAPREAVFTALHDPEILRHAIPGCQRILLIDDDRYQCEISLKIGPVSGTFRVSATVYDADPPRGYSIFAEARAEAGAGGAKGNAHMALAVVDSDTTNVAYHITAAPSGSLAELANDLLTRTANVLATEFFERLELLIANGLDADEPIRHAVEAPRAPRVYEVLPPQPAEPAAGRHAPAPVREAGVAVVERYQAPAPVPAAKELREPADLRPSERAEEPRQQVTPVEKVRFEQREPAPPQWEQSRRQPAAAGAQDEERRNPARWFFAFLGLVIIVLLLSDSF